MAAWDQITIVGVGLIGGSIGRALRDRRLCREVVGVGRSAERLEQAVAAGVIHRGEMELARGAAGADVVVVCTPVDSVVPLLCESARHARPDALLLDAGSTKERIVRQANERLPARHRFVGSHPLAGSEKGGFRHARGDLLEQRLVVLTPTEQTRQDAVDEAIHFWQALGATVELMEPGRHDQVLAQVSHLPHLVASALAAVTPEADLPIAAGGWRDSTRIASGDADLWMQILADNRLATLAALDALLAQLQRFRHALEAGKRQELLELLQSGKNIRDVVAD